MRSLQIGTLLLGLGVCTSARANTFFIDYENRPMVDPTEGFDTDCLGATEADDCGARAAAMQAELVETLSALDGRGDEATIQLFSKAVQSGDPHLQEIGVRYMERRPSVPTGLWDKIKSFFFGENPGLGQASAEVLQASSDETEQQLAELYLEARPYRDYTGTLPDETGADDPWAAAAARDRQIEAMFSYHEEELFQPATRLLMNDGTSADFTDPAVRLPVTGYVTDASIDEVKKHFTRLFGKAPYPSVKATNDKIQALSMELAALQPKILSGDQAAIKRIGEVTEELAAVQESALVGGLLNFEALRCDEHEFWIDGDLDKLGEAPLPRVVTVGAEPLLGRTAIRYFGGGGMTRPAPDGDGGDGPDGGTGDGGGVGGGNGDGDGDGDGKGGGSTPGKKGSGGCSTLPYGDSQAALWLLAALGALFTYQRRNRR